MEAAAATPDAESVSFVPSLSEASCAFPLQIISISMSYHGRKKKKIHSSGERDMHTIEAENSMQMQVRKKNGGEMDW